MLIGNIKYFLKIIIEKALIAFLKVMFKLISEHYFAQLLYSIFLFQIL